MSTHSFEPSQAQYGTPQSSTPLGGPAPGEALGSDLGASFSWAFSAIARHWKALILPAIAWFALIFIVMIIGTFAVLLPMFSAAASMESSGQYITPEEESAAATAALLGSGGSLVMMFLLVLVTLGITAAWQSGLANAAGKIVRGESPSFGDGFVNFKLLPTALVVVLVSLVSMITIVGPLIVMFFWSYAVYAQAIDRLSLGAALKASAQAALKKPLHTLVALVVTYLVSSILGATLIGGLVALPIVGLLFSSIFTRITGRVPAQAPAA